MGITLLIAIAYPAIIAALFYLAFYRPMMQQQRRQRQQLASLQVGDEVLTQGGLIAVVKEIRVPKEPGPTELILGLGNGVEVRALATAVVERLRAVETLSMTTAEKAEANVE